jgi:predicted NUDIX family NTP pyrophosphohydrolase
VPQGELLPLGEVRQSGGKLVTVWALQADLDIDAFRPGTFEMTWPPRSGRTAVFPELDQVAWIAVESAPDKVIAAQVAFIDRLLQRIRADSS